MAPPLSAKKNKKLWENGEKILTRWWIFDWRWQQQKQYGIYSLTKLIAVTSKEYTPWKFINIAPENRPSQKESTLLIFQPSFLPTIIFQGQTR